VQKNITHIDPAVDPARDFCGHPIALALLFSTEFFMRLAYFGLKGLLILWICAPIASGGFGWPVDEALKLFAILFGIALILPIIGGVIADRMLGHQRALALGLCLAVIGYSLLAIPPFVWHAQLFGLTADAKALLQAVDQPLVRPWLDAEYRQALLEGVNGFNIGAANHSAIVEAALSYTRLTSAMFYSGVALFCAGIGLATAPNCLMTVKIYSEGDIRQNAGWIIFYGASSSAFFLSSFLVGTLGEKVGWHSGLLAAAVVQLIGLAVFLRFRRRLLGEICRLPQRPEPHAAPFRIAADEIAKLRIIGVFFVFFILFAGGWEQIGGIVNVFVLESVDRSVMGYQIPTTWFQSLVPGFSVLVMPLFAWAMLNLARRGREPSPALKMLLALSSVLIASLALFAAAQQAASGALASPWWIVLMGFFLAVGDYLMLPMSIVLVGVLAPARFAGQITGVWLSSVGIGLFIFNFSAGILQPFGMTVVFGAFAAVFALAVTVIVILMTIFPHLVSVRPDGAPVS
jgi:POT family proton-dependent oligopeptide transporter